MTKKKPTSYPYIPNSEPAVKKEMLESVGANNTEEFYADIPEKLRYRDNLKLPTPLLSEYELVRHVENLLVNNQTSRENLNFLGAGCYQHHVPAVCDEVNSRGEFLTAYAGEPYDDHGRFQALFEYQSMMGELLNMDVVNVPTYDGFQASATALRMAARITGRKRVLLTRAINPDKLSMIKNYLKPEIEIELVDYDQVSGLVDLGTLKKMLSEDLAAIYFENPSYFGGIETNADQIADLAHQFGTICVVSVDPISLGLLNPPVEYGADIVCGDIQPLGMHMLFGGGHAGFIATRDEEDYVMEYPSRLFGIAPTIVEGEYGFGDVAYERTSFAKREGGKEWVGTASALWGITAGVYLALMGPQGMLDVGEAIMQRSRYAKNKVAEVDGLKVWFSDSPNFKEFIVNFDGTGKSVAQINQGLLEHGIFGGKDLSKEFPDLGQSALYCVTEVHCQADIDRLVETLAEVTK
ncbi:MAG TPA: aminomethyl-transferring glycine dehydrogenase subunit GcvPA [Anaerolineales bacterium]|nr:aminomethyl-transferring glycine dehydrogenase subunit GcvPA [Anaerolineales bacterium]